MEEWMDGGVDCQKSGWMADEWMHQWMNWGMDASMDEWIDR